MEEEVVPCRDQRLTSNAPFSRLFIERGDLCHDFRHFSRFLATLTISDTVGLGVSCFCHIERTVFGGCGGGHDRGEKPEFTSLRRSDTPECLTIFLQRFELHSTDAVERMTNSPWTKL